MMIISVSEYAAQVFVSGAACDIKTMLYFSGAQELIRSSSSIICCFYSYKDIIPSIH